MFRERERVLDIDPKVADCALPLVWPNRI